MNDSRSAEPSDPLVKAWRRFSDRFAQGKGGGTPIRDAFAAGWDAAQASAAPLPSYIDRKWLDANHPLEYGTPGTIDHMLRCPTCQEWSPCRVRTLFEWASAAPPKGGLSPTGELTDYQRGYVDGNEAASATRQLLRDVLDAHGESAEDIRCNCEAHRKARRALAADKPGSERETEDGVEP